ncbi:MAG: DNA polymerase III subunit alpha [Candidatus Saccharibacteria bacterium]
MAKQIKDLSPSDYVHLHNHTQYSLLDGLTKIGPLLDFVKENKMHAVAKTDHGTLSGTIEFYKEAKAKGVKPIVGIEIYVASRKHTDKDPQKDKIRYHLILLAMNQIGYQNLMRLSTLANLEGFYYQPRVDHELLEKYNKGIIAMSACLGGEIASNLRQGQDKKAEEVAMWHKQIFKDRYYLEVQDHGHPDNPMTNKEQNIVNNKIIALGEKLDIPIVATVDAHYLKSEDQEAHEILLCVGTGSFLSETKRLSLKEYPLHVESPQELINRWGKDHPDFITNTKIIADQCNLEIELGKIMLPKFPVPEHHTERSYLEQLVYRGLVQRYCGLSPVDAEKLSNSAAKKLLPKEIIKRADYELGVVENMNFSGYFLIIWDFIKWGKDRKIVFGPGRGSAAGSIISYALKITELDPLKYDLLFERFLNPDRISMPDIDIDIQDSRRDEVIQYCVEKYGKDRVANIVTFGRMAARAAVRDVARVLQVPYSDADRIAKMIPPPVQGRHTPLSASIKENSDLKQEYDTNATSRQVFDMAVRLEGTVRSHGVHAAGVVIAPADIVKFVPLEMAQKGVITTQYAMGPIEDLGLLKMDFLGLSNLTTIKNALRIIRKVYGKEFEVSDIPLDDKKTYKLLGKGDTTGVFQLESAGMKRYLKQLKPSVLEDIIAMVALYRPGPMQFIDDFIARKNGEKKIEYMHPKMENALRNTYGVLVYQEQVMQISRDLCGFSGGQSDTLRKGIAKKIPEVLAKMKVEFIEGAVKHSGADKKQMELFWKQLEDFAAYCFNKSHAACYAMISYWTAYLKAHYPAAFMAALMTSDYDDTDRLAIEISECKHMGLIVLPPDVNESYHEFGVVPHQKDKTPEIRFGMNAVKNVGHGAVAEIIRAREEGGAFVSLTDFLQRVNNRLVNRKVWESLIKSGAFDRYGDRGAILENVDTLLAVGAKLSKDSQNGQTDLFGASLTDEAPLLKLNIPETSTLYSEHEYLQWERELLGLYLSKHPLQDYDGYLAEKTVPLAKIAPEDDGKSATIGGIISSIRQITTKNGQPMAFIKLEDLVGDETELVVFPNAFKDTAEVWVTQNVVIVKGKVNGLDKSGALMPEFKVLVDSAQVVPLEDAKEYEPTGHKAILKNSKRSSNDGNNYHDQQNIEASKLNKRLYLRMQDASDHVTLQMLKTILDEYPGQNEAVLVLGIENKQIIKLPQLVNDDSDLIISLQELIGEENVKCQ